MKTRNLLILTLLLLTTGVWTRTAQAETVLSDPTSKVVSPVGMLNPDGTLNPQAGFHGTINLSGYQVDVDPMRGPVFTPTLEETSATPGHWASFGDGGGAVDGTVRAMVVSGTDVYIGGSFTDLANLPAADYIAKWDGANWSALSANSTGDGAIISSVYSLALNGTALYVGGAFSNVSDNGTVLTAADYIARWDTVGETWAALGSNGSGNGSVSSTVNKIAFSGSDLYVAGYFTNVNNGGTVLNAADYVAKWDGTNWSALGSNGANNGSLGAVAFSLAVSGSDVYVGGNFAYVNNGGAVLSAADYVAKWDGTNWAALGSNGASNGSISGTVYALAANGSDVYVGGQFINVNNGGAVLNTADYLARWDGTNWSALGHNGAGDGSLNGNVRALFFDGPDLYVGGSFANINVNGTPLLSADYLAKWDGTNWSAIGNNGAGDGAIPPKSSPAVYAFTKQGGDLLVGGSFYDLNNGGTILPQADHLTRWDGTNWSTLGTAPNGALVGGYSGNSVKAIAIIGADMYVGGTFTDISNHGVNIPEGDNIVKWDGTNWSALGGNGAGNGSINSDVNALAVIGTDLYVGGRFTNVNNNGTPLPEADYIARWDTMTNTWSALSSDGAGNGAIPASSFVYELAVSGSNLYVAGGFTNVNNGGTVIPEADYLARWDGTNWAALGSNGAGDGVFNNQVLALTFDTSGNLYAGGAFTNAGGEAQADHLARWNGTNWSALGSNGAGNGSLNAIVYAMALDGANLYVGGNFTNVNNGGLSIPEADYVAKWDGTNWAALGSNGGGNGALNYPVYALAINGTEIYIGGLFFNVNNNGVILYEADHIARWDGVNWSALGNNGAGNGSINGNNDLVFAIQISGSGQELLVGGQFANVNDSGTVIPEADYLTAYGLSMDLVPPTVLTISRMNNNPTAASIVDYFVSFTESVTGLDPSDFTLATSGITGAVITGISGVDSSYTVHVSTGSGTGTLRLDLNDDDSIQDPSGNPLGGVGAGNGSFTGETYQIIHYFIYLPVIIRE
jgi:hypothetical protein